jgi:hypothetical protein
VTTDVEDSILPVFACCCTTFGSSDNRFLGIQDLYLTLASNAEIDQEAPRRHTFLAMSKFYSFRVTVWRVASICSEMSTYIAGGVGRGLLTARAGFRSCWQLCVAVSSIASFV